MPQTLRTPLPLLLAACVLVHASASPADEVSDKQKAAAIANLKIVGSNSNAIAETDHLIVSTPLPAGKTKALADAAEKAYIVARKALQYEPNDEPWKGKLTVYVFDDRKKYTMYMLQVVKEKTKDPYFLSIRSDEPFVIKGVEVGAKPTDAELASEVGTLVSVALLTAKVGPSATVPEWVRFGFGKASIARASGTGSKAMNDLKSRARAAIQGAKGKPPAKAEFAWVGGDDDETIAASLMDYFAFGPPAAMNFSRFLMAFRPSDSVAAPTIDNALEAVMWKKEDLDKNWKKYVLTGK